MLKKKKNKNYTEWNEDLEIKGNSSSEIASLIKGCWATNSSRVFTL